MRYFCRASLITQTKCLIYTSLFEISQVSYIEISNNYYQHIPS